MLEYVSLPDHYTSLLRENLQSSSQYFKNLPLNLSQIPEIAAIMPRFFSDCDQRGRIDATLRSVGWQGIRNRIAAIYLFYQDRGRFPAKDDMEEALSYIDDLLKFEEQARTFSIEGYSRVFLLGFYLKMNDIYHGGSLFDDVLANERLWSLLKRCKKRTVRGDWLILLVLHLFEAADSDDGRLETIVDDGVEFSDLLEIIDENDKEEMVRSLLYYAASISDYEMILSKTV